MYSSPSTCSSYPELLFPLLSLQYKESRKDVTESSFGNFSSILTPSILQKLHSTNEFVCALAPNLWFLLQDDHVCAQVVPPLAQSMFGLFPFIHVICIISLAHEIMKT